MAVNLNGVQTEGFLNFARCAIEFLDMIIKTNSTPLVLSALFFALRCYLPTVSSQIAGNDTYPNTMEGRGFWSTIPMPVISHFAGDKSRKNSTIVKEGTNSKRACIFHASKDVTDFRLLVQLGLRCHFIHRN